MRLPFGRKRDETDLRIYRDLKSGKITLRMVGTVGLPFHWEEPILLIEANLHTQMTEATARQLRDQIDMLLPRPEEPQEFPG